MVRRYNLVDVALFYQVGAASLDQQGEGIAGYITSGPCGCILVGYSDAVLEYYLIQQISLVNEEFEDH